MSSTVEGLKEFLKKNGISVVRLSKNTGIPQDRIYSWLRGKGNPKAEDQKILDGVMGIGITPNELETKKPTSNDAGEVIADPQIPGMYQDIVRELIESSKAQRVLIQSQADISKALLEERQLIRDTANAAIELAGKATSPAIFATKSEVGVVRTSLERLEKSVDGNYSALHSIQQLLANRAGDLPKMSKGQIVNYLHGSADEDSQSKKTSKR